MGTSRFVRPETCILNISNDDWLLVKRRLTAGEQRARFTRMYLAGVDGTRHVDPMNVGMATVTAYLLDWSLTDEDGKQVAIKGKPIQELAAVIDGLDHESFSEIRTAIEVHEKAIEAAREAEKKTTPTGDSKSRPTSASLSVVGGASSGSAS
jgi:hypothetical protein